MSAAWPSDTRGMPLWVKLAAFCAAAIVAIQLVSLAIATRIGTTALAREQEQLGGGIARLVALEAADSLLQEDWVTVDELAVRTALTRGIGYCFIVHDREVVGSSLEPGVAERLLALRSDDRDDPIVVADDGHRYLDLVAPIVGGKAGTVRIGVDMEALQSTREAIEAPTAFSAAVAILLAVAAAIVLGRRISRPIEEIIDAADRFDPAAPLSPIHPRGGREISALGRRFNGMMARLAAAHEEQERVRVRALANERLATLGSLVAGVAHEVNNPLASLKSASALLREDQADPSARARDLDLIDLALDQIEAIVRQLLDFGRQRPLEIAPVAVSLLAEEAARLAAMQLKRRGIAVDVIADPRIDGAPVLADRRQVSQALLNLLLNGAYASKDFARLRVRLARRGPLLGIAVEDDGPGIPQAIRDKVFDPFFSTKPPGQGTGLGLTMARTIADRHHGALELDCPATGGTVATLWLPAAPDEARTLEPTASRAGGSDASGGAPPQLLTEPEGRVRSQTTR